MRSAMVFHKWGRVTVRLRCLYGFQEVAIVKEPFFVRVPSEGTHS